MIVNNIENSLGPFFSEKKKCVRCIIPVDPIHDLFSFPFDEGFIGE
jgi:hypothetical protein